MPNNKLSNDNDPLPDDAIERAKAFVIADGYHPELEFYAKDVYEIAVKFAAQENRQKPNNKNVITKEDARKLGYHRFLTSGERKTSASGYGYGFDAGYDAGLNARTPQQPDWVKCDERLPTDKGAYIFQTHAGKFVPRYLDTERDLKWMVLHVAYVQSIYTAWQKIEPVTAANLSERITN